MTSPRLDFPKTNPQALQAMRALQAFVDQSGIDPKLLELIKIRASQINACAFCLDMHLHAARQLGESQQRLDTLLAWHEVPYFTDQERAALAWTEALTRLSPPEPVPDQAYEQALAHFTPPELVALSTAIVAINGWNRLCIAFQTQPPNRAH